MICVSGAENRWPCSQGGVDRTFWNSHRRLRFLWAIGAETQISQCSALEGAPLPMGDI